MILTEFDSNKSAVFTPANVYKKPNYFPKTVIGFFQHTVFEEFVKLFNPKLIYTIKSFTTDFDIYEIETNGEKIGVMKAPLGAPYCVSIFEEVVFLGAKNILLSGSCGCLERAEEYSIILPTSAIRDEGTSYHYAPASDEIELDKKVILSLKNTLKNLKISFKEGKTWTNDALYRETALKVQKRKEMGAIAVDMECSAMTAFAKFRGINFGEIFYVADDLSSDNYEIRSLIVGELSRQAKIIPVLIKCAENLSKDI